MSMREFPVRRRPPSRPSWLLPVIIVVIVIVAVAAVIVFVRMMGSTEVPAGAEEAVPQPACSTVTALPAEALPVPAKVRVNVYNSTKVSGLASRTARDLKKRGFQIEEVANDPVGIPIEGVARIRYGPSSAKRAELLAYYIPGAQLVQIDRGGPKVDVALGADFVAIAPQPDVDAAIGTPEVVVTGPGCASPSASGVASSASPGATATDAPPASGDATDATPAEDEAP